MGKIRSAIGEFAYEIYGHRLVSALPQNELPKHVGVILDGNRRWAADQGSSTAHGHRVGGEKARSPEQGADRNECLPHQRAYPTTAQG